MVDRLAKLLGLGAELLGGTSGFFGVRGIRLRDLVDLGDGGCDLIEAARLPLANDLVVIGDEQREILFRSGRR